MNQIFVMKKLMITERLCLYRSEYVCLSVWEKIQKDRLLACNVTLNGMSVKKKTVYKHAFILKLPGGWKFLQTSLNNWSLLWIAEVNVELWLYRPHFIFSINWNLHSFKKLKFQNKFKLTPINFCYLYNLAQPCMNDTTFIMNYECGAKMDHLKIFHTTPKHKKREIWKSF